MTNKWIAELHERAARSFINLLSPVNGILAGEPDPRSFIYRGQGSDKYELVPSVFRGRRIPFPDRRPASRRTNENQIWAEIELLWEFFQLADARGLRLPEDSQHFRRILANCRDPDFIDLVAKEKAVWPPDELLSTLALAQHYGVHTRLLDWTRSSYIAAYFAAVDALEHRNKGHLAVWAFDESLIDDETKFEWLSERIRIVTAPAVDIPNLLAQQGLFLLFRESGFRKSAHFDVRSYEKILVGQLEFDIDRPILFKFTLPASQASQLLGLLSAIGIDASSLFPGYGGVARALRERLHHPVPGWWYDSSTARMARQRYVKIRRRWQRKIQGKRVT